MLSEVPGSPKMSQRRVQQVLFRPGQQDQILQTLCKYYADFCGGISNDICIHEAILWQQLQALKSDVEHARCDQGHKFPRTSAICVIRQEFARQLSTPATLRRALPARLRRCCADLQHAWTHLVSTGFAGQNFQVLLAWEVRTFMQSGGNQTVYLGVWALAVIC